MKKKRNALHLPAAAAALAMLTASLPLPAAAGSMDRQYVVVKKVQGEACTSLTVLQTDEKATHRNHAGPDAVLGDTLLMYSEQAPLTDVVEQAEFGDIITFTGDVLMCTLTTQYNRFCFLPDVPTGSFEITGSVADTPLASVQMSGDAEAPALAVTDDAGVLYYVSPGEPGDWRIRLVQDGVGERPADMSNVDFSYIPGKNGLYLNPAPPPEAHTVVAGIIPRGLAVYYVLVPLLKEGVPYSGEGAFCTTSLPGIDGEVRIGDLLTEAESLTPEIDGGLTCFQEDLQLVGNALDLYGEDFREVLRMQLIENYWHLSFYHLVPAELYGVTSGDLTGDGDVSITDVIALNKSLMLGTELSSTAYVAADVDRNGWLTETDSLNILKHIVGLVPDLSALAE